jgi:hypothetical protein
MCDARLESFYWQEVVVAGRWPLRSSMAHAFALHKVAAVLLLAGMSLLFAGCDASPPPARPLIKVPSHPVSLPISLTRAPVATRGLGPLPPVPGKAPLYAIVRAYMAASSRPNQHSLITTLTVERLDAVCPGQVVELSAWWRRPAAVPAAGDPAVTVEEAILCFRVSAENPPLIIGLQAHARPASLDVEGGLEYLSADPAGLEGAGASLFIPAARGGYQVGAFAVAGELESVAEGEPLIRSIAVVGISAVWADEALREDRFLLCAVSPDRTQFNVGLAVWAGPDGHVPTGRPGPQYQEDVQSDAVDELSGKSEDQPAGGAEASAASKD